VIDKLNKILNTKSKKKYNSYITVQQVTIQKFAINGDSNSAALLTNVTMLNPPLFRMFRLHADLRFSGLCPLNLYQAFRLCIPAKGLPGFFILNNWCLMTSGLVSRCFYMPHSAQSSRRFLKLF